MSELNEINGIVFGGKKYTVGGTGEVPEGLIDPADIEWGVYAYSSSPHEIRELRPPTSLPYHIEFPDYNGDTLITSVGYGAFRGMGIKSVKLPNYLESISGSYAFAENQLTSVIFGDSLTSIGSHVFRDNQLTSLNLPDSLTSIDRYAFHSNQLTSVVFGDSLTSIGDYAFQNNQLTSVVIPDSVTSIGFWAFRDNPLEEVSVHIDTTLGSSAFPSSAVITPRIPEGYIYGEGLTSIANTTYSGMDLTGSITIADSVTSIGDSAFRYNQITSVDLPDSVTSIGWMTFDSNQITSLDLPNSLTSIGDNAFRNNQLTSIVIPDSVASIGFYAFDNNPLTEVSIGPNTTYNSSAFPSSAVITVREN